MRLKTVVVSNWLGRLMYRRGWGGVTLSAPGWILVLFWAPDSEYKVPDWLWRHEVLGHGSQIKRYGWFGYYCRYVWGLRRGYQNHEMERDARTYE
jgi:hypothetical protein